MASKKSSNNFLVQGGILATAAILVRFIGLLYRAPLINMIGKEGMGYYSNAYSIYNIALLISSYSLPLAVSKLVASRTIKKQHRNSFRIFMTALVIGAAVGLIASLSVFFGADYLAVKILESPRSAIPLKVLAPTIFVFAIMGVLRGFFQGNNSMVQTSVSQVIEQIVNAIVSIVAAYFLLKRFGLSEDASAYGAAGATLGTLLGAIASLIFLIFVFTLNRKFIKRKIVSDTSNYVDSYAMISKMLAITVIPVILSQTVYQLTGIIDSSIFNKIMASQGHVEEVRVALIGLYSTIFLLLTNVPVSIASALATAIVPSIVISITNGMMMEVKNKIGLGIKSTMMVAFPSAAGLTVLASPIIQLIFRRVEVELPAKMLQIGSIAIIFFVFSTITNGILQGLDKMHIPIIHSAISLGIHVVFMYLLLTYAKIGIYALVIGNISFPLVVCILNWRYLRKLLDYQQEIKKTFLIPCISAIIMGIVAFLAYRGLYALVSSNAISCIV
ncbi:MAG TPA: polysaccharide biosynthesis protein, partial [Clostridiales bacterium]|nr:polysaccharide biosynthesis protein [Clostridiales bacterium]